MLRATTGYVALLNGTELQDNKRSKRPKKISPNTNRMTNVARFGIHRTFKLGLVAKSIFFFICDQEEINTIKTTITSILCRS